MKGKIQLIILITGVSHTGKTLLAQKLIEKHNFPCLNLDLLKMGLIRSGRTSLTPDDDELLTDYLWPITKEMIKTAVENNQNLIVEGCYIPFDWQKDFDAEYLESIEYICLVFSEKYIRNNFDRIKQYENVVEHRLYDDFDIEMALRDNAEVLKKCIEYGVDYRLADDEYFDFI